MLTSFDWLRRCDTGAELLAVLEYLRKEPNFLSSYGEEIGPPHFALDGPCRRCWIYPRLSPQAHYCQPCQAILTKAHRLGHLSRRSIVLWGFVNRLPRQLQTGEGFSTVRVLGTYIRDPNHFLLMIHRRALKPWMQEVALYHGHSLKGILQIFPPTAFGRGPKMGEIICRAAHHEARFPMDQLRVRFYSAPHQVLIPHVRDQKGILTFEVTEFLSLLEMATVFRTLLSPEAQQILYELLNLEDASREQFYWGRFWGYLSPEARDMLNAWAIRQWPKSRVKLLYELTNYVAFYQSH